MRHSEQRSRSDQMARSPRGETRAWQIGPRIRIGGSVGALGEKIKKYVPSPASMIGTGTPVGLIGSAINHSVASDAMKGAAITPFAVAATKAMGGNGNAPGTPGTPGASDGSGGGSPLSLSSFLDLGLGAANMYGAAKLGQQSTDYAKKAEDAVTGSYNERAPLRLSGIEGMLHPDANTAAQMAGVNAIKGPQVAAPPIPVPMADPRLAMANRVAARNPFAQPPIPLRTV